MYSQLPQPVQHSQQLLQGDYPIMGHNNPYISAETNVIPPPFPPQTMNGMALAATQTEPLPHTTQLQTVALTLIQLAEFASTMVYLMWHARRPSVMALHSASVDNTSNVLVHRDPDHNRETATIANETSLRFKRFCKDILTATQLSESVVMLALKYIAMLLQNNPNIQGAEGSEYRLFTVALMLGNKFLDDNTYTNKTWADVSGMKVSDLNIMELEFLDVLKFRIFVRKEEHDRWKVSLFALREQLEIAYQAEEQEKRQSVIETTLKSMGLWQATQQQQDWNYAHHNPNHPMMTHQQQQTAHQQYMYLLSNAQQAYYTSRLPNRPLTRVPLRIPRYPVYHPQTAPPQPMTSVNNPIMTSIYDNPIPEPVYSTQSFEATTSVPVVPSMLPPTSVATSVSYNPYPSSSQPTSTMPVPTSYASTDPMIATSIPFGQHAPPKYNSAGREATGADVTSTMATLPMDTRTTITQQQPLYHYDVPVSAMPASHPFPSNTMLPTTNVTGQPMDSFYAEQQQQQTMAFEEFSVHRHQESVIPSTNPYAQMSRPLQKQQQGNPTTASNHVQVHPAFYHPTASHELLFEKQRQATGPTPEDPLTAVESYQTRII